MVDFITLKKRGATHTPDELNAFVAALVDPVAPLPDYQVAAWLMAVCWQGLSFDETAALTLAMASHGRTCDWSDLGAVVDKHSTGGVGDKVSLVLVPLVASLGIPVAKFSGRALGFTGGTLDKLESIPCFTVALSEPQMRSVLTNCGCVIAGQTADMVPADKLLYALRDVTATIDSIPLIAASVMSKKIAGGANGIVLDVKYGDGAFMPTIDSARQLAETMVAIGQRTGRVVRAALSSMDQPLGNAVGNALEIREVIATLRGDGPADLAALCIELALQMVEVYLECGGNPGEDSMLTALDADRLRSHIASGQALHTFKKWVGLQGGDPRVGDDPDSILPSAAATHDLVAWESEVITGFQTKAIGELVRAMGGGRLTKADTIDHGVGLVFQRKLGDPVAPGETVATIHARSVEEATRVAASLKGLINIGKASDLPTSSTPVHTVLT